MKNAALPNMPASKGARIAVLLFAVLSAWIAPAAAVCDEAVDLAMGDESRNLIDFIKILEDKDGEWTVEDVSSAEFQRRWKPPESGQREGGGVNLRVSPSTWWLTFELKASDRDAANDNWLLVIADNRFIGEAELYSPPPNRPSGDAPKEWLVERQSTGDDGLSVNNVMLNLPAIGESPKRFYLRIESDHYIFLPLAVRTASCQLASKEQTSFFEGMFFGVIIVIAVLNLLVFAVLKDRSSLWYMLFVVCVGLYFASIMGFVSGVAKHLGPMYFGYLHAIGISAIVISCILFERNFLQTKENLPRTDKMLLANMVLAIASTLASPIITIAGETGFVISSNLTIALGIIAPFATIIPGVLRLRQGFRPARLYLVGWSVFSLSAFFFAVPVISGIDGWLIFQIGCATNVFLLTLATVEKLRAMREQRDAMTRAKDTAQKAQSESEEKYRNIFDNSPVGIFRVAMSEEETLLEANAAFRKIFGYGPGEHPPKSVLADSWVDPDVHGRVHEQMDKNGNVEEMEARFRRKDGTVAWCRFSARYYPEKGYFEGTLADITERKLAEQQMFRAEKMASLGQIIAGVAHEINNPNNFIYFNLPILQRYIDSIKPILDEKAEKDSTLKFLNMPYAAFIEDTYKLLDNMKHGSKRITDIVSELKTYVRSSEEEEKRPEAMDAVVSRVMTLVGKQVRKRVKKLDVEVEEGLSPVIMNAGKIEQVLINLVINAGHAADKDDSWVRLKVGKCQKDSNLVEISVEDNGCGIPRENLQRIFEPFFTTKGEESGTGLGLAISHRIVEDHGGTIEVESEVGKGTIFTIRLPAAAR